jgi:hypothetical protein|tara:strand:+ start:66 stop:296 length:231 start_codon:yes stop_codon:yes gene_type:complete
MKIQFPGASMSMRFFERVETVDDQYDIFDVGVEQADGSIDSVVVGGSFSYAKSLLGKANEAVDNKIAKVAKAATEV